MSTPEITIKSLGPKADGISEGPRGRVYVERTAPGDRVRVKIRRGPDGLLRGDITEMVSPGKARIKPPCVHYDQCGGCTAQHLEQGFYREWKQNMVREALDRQGIHPKMWKDPVFIGGANRRRATFAAFKKKDRITLGYYKRRSHEVTDINACLIADPAIMALREKLKTLLIPVLKEGGSADVFLQLEGGAFDMVVTGPVGRKGTPDLAVREAMAAIIHGTNVARISWRSRERDEIETIIEKNPVVTGFGKLSVALPPAAFLQPTKEGQVALVAAVMDALPAKGKFADLFCGCGTFSGPMLERGSVDAYESGRTAVAALMKARASHPLKVFERDLFRNPLRREDLNRYDAIVFDPPRAGAEAQSKAMASSKVRMLIGVSCNPATFARDAKILKEGGYRLESVQVVDQFLWSHHVEIVGVFRK